jgi:hypothetical protein
MTGRTLATVIPQMQALVGNILDRCITDAGYRGHNAPPDSMNRSVTQFAAAPAMVGRNRSLWRQLIDTVIKGPPRTTADEIAEYLALHQYDFSPALRVELERRYVCVAAEAKPAKIPVSN